jgi:hypothetical protein
MVDQAYLVPIKDLREICKELTHKKFHYEIIEVNKDFTSITYSEGDGLNASTFTFPIVCDLKFPLIIKNDKTHYYEDDLLACLHIFTYNQIQYRMYMEDEKIKIDGITDWLRFWVPLDALLLRETTIPKLDSWV